MEHVEVPLTQGRVALIDPDDAAIEAFGEFACTNADLLSGVQP